MITYICDKCGEHIYSMFMTRMTIETTEGIEKTIDEYHFCNDCIQKFREWTEDEEK